MYNNLCSIRLVADLALGLSFPILIARIIVRGNAGISPTSQVLHLLVFLLRYSDLRLDLLSSLFNPDLAWRDQFINAAAAFSFAWTPIMKVYLIGITALVLIAMGYRAYKDKTKLSINRQTLLATLKQYAIYIVPTLILAYRFNYASFSWLPSYQNANTSDRLAPPGSSFPFVISDYLSLNDLLNITLRDADEVAWATSIYLAAVADIPQFKTYYRYANERIDWWLMSSMGLLASSRLLYIVHWIARYMEDHVFDTISFVGGVVQVFTFWLFFVLVITKVNDVLSENAVDLEAQLAEYDASRWGEEETQVLFFEVHDEEK